MSEWVRVEEGLPDRGGHVWVVTALCPREAVLAQYDDFFTWPWRDAQIHDCRFYGKVTHWHPLTVPEPPA